ncbi:MAG: hypothetical protein JWN32_1120 [Solirubrobacterales bacterium]|nr:hypothetical protein [Solirubrobacterales bacterium]
MTTLTGAAQGQYARAVAGVARLTAGAIVAAALVVADAAPAATRPAATKVLPARIPARGGRLAVSCPAGYAAVSGATVKAGAVSTTLGDPAGPGRWSFAFGPTRDGRPAKVTVATRCVRFRAIGERIRDGGAVHRQLASGEGWWGHVSCPRGYSPLGLGTRFDQVPADASAGPMGVELRKAWPVPGGFDFAVVNGSSAVRARLVARCVHFIQTLRSTVTRLIAPGRSTVAHNCPAHDIGLSTAWDLTGVDSVGVRVLGTSMTGPGHGHWTLSSAASVPATAPLVQLCLGAP